MATEIDGGVVLQRIYEYLLANPANVENLSLLMDIDGLDQAVQVPFSMLESALSTGVYEPTTQPVISAGVLTTDLNNRQLSVFQPRLSTGTRTINTNFDWGFTNPTGVINHSQTLSLTGTIVIDFSSQANVKVSNPSSLGTWDDVLETLQIDAVTDDIIEFNFLYDSSSNVWDLKIGEVRV